MPSYLSDRHTSQRGAQRRGTKKSNRSHADSNAPTRGTSNSMPNHLAAVMQGAKPRQGD